MELFFQIIAWSFVALLVLSGLLVCYLYAFYPPPKLGQYDPELTYLLNFPETYHGLLNLALKDLDNDQLFMFAAQGCKLSDSDLAVQMQMSRTTVERWRKGSTRPYPLMRRGIYLWFLKNTQDYNLSELIKD